MGTAISNPIRIDQNAMNNVTGNRCLNIAGDVLALVVGVAHVEGDEALQPVGVLDDDGCVEVVAGGHLVDLLL